MISSKAPLFSPAATMLQYNSSKEPETCRNAAESGTPSRTRSRTFFASVPSLEALRFSMACKACSTCKPEASRSPMSSVKRITSALVICSVVSVAASVFFVRSADCD